MNIPNNRLLCIVLFLSVLLCFPIDSEYHTAHITLNAGPQEHNNDCVNRHDFSYNNLQSNPNINSPSNHQPHFDRYDSQSFNDYFTSHGYTEQEVLNQQCLYMLDEFVKCAQTYPNYNCTIQKIHATLKNFNLAQKAYYTLKGSYCHGLQKRIQFLYNQLSTFKNNPPTNKQPYYRDHSLTAFHEQKTEYEILHSTYKECTPSLSSAIEKRINAYNTVENGHLASYYENKSYILNNNVTQLLHHYGHDTTQFTQCHGNQLHHAIHQESLNILAHINNLSFNSILYDHQEALVDFTVAMVDYNHENLTDKAMHIGNLCWTLLDCGQAVIEGTVLGIYSAATDIINNPIEAAVCIVAGKQVLAYQLCKVLYNVADISITAISNVDQAKDKWNKYIAPLNDIIDAINNKEITLHDAIKNGTALAVGWKAQSKLLSGLGKFCNTIKQKSINFVNTNSTFNPQEYLTTPEGLLFKATAKADILKHSGQTTASHLKNNVDNKVTKNNSIKGLIKKERLPTTGKLRYVPPKKLHVNEGLPRVVWHDKRKGFVDRFDNIWLRGESRTKGHGFEWDVQLSKQGVQQVGWMTRDNSHLNVSLDGKVTHK